MEQKAAASHLSGNTEGVCRTSVVGHIHTAGSGEWLVQHSGRGDQSNFASELHN